MPRSPRALSGAVLLTAALALSLGGTGCKRPPSAKKRRLVVYCSVHADWCDSVTRSFEEKTGIKVSMSRKSSGESLAQLRAERRNPRGDVWFGGTGDGHVQAAESRLTGPYRSPRLGELHPWARELAGEGDFRATGLYMGALAYGYNTEWLKEKGYPPPKTWADLLRPEFKGEIQMANPQSSGTAYTVLATLVQLMGEEKGFDYLRRLHPSVNQYTLSGAAPIRAAARGETGIGIVFLHDALTQVAAGFPIEVVLPEEGTGFEIGGVSIIRGCRHPEEAKLFVDYVLSAEAQELGAKAHSFQWPSNVKAKPPPYAPDVSTVKLIDFDLARFGTKEERTRLLTRWFEDVRDGA